MKATKIIHNGESRIKIDFPYNQEIATLIKQIPGAKWSKTQGAWHIPYGKKEFVQLKTLFPLIEYAQKEIIAEPQEPTVTIPKEVIAKQIPTVKGVSVQVLGRNIILKLPKNTLDTHFILSIRYSRWDTKQFCWFVPNYPGNLDLIKDFFKDRIGELIIHDEYDVRTSSQAKKTIKTNELLIIKTNSKRLKLIFGFNKELSNLLRKMPFNTWDAANKWWTVPFTEQFLIDIKTVAKAQNLEVVYEEEVKTENKATRVTAYDITNYRTCPEQYILKLKELRYSENTIKSYKGLFEEFINYYPKYDIKSIDEKMIIAFMQYLVIERKFPHHIRINLLRQIHFTVKKNTSDFATIFQGV